MAYIGTKKVTAYFNGKQILMPLFCRVGRPIVSGTLKFKEDITLPSEDLSLNIRFISDGKQYKRMVITRTMIFYCPNEDIYGSTTAFYGKWNKDSFRTVTFDGVQGASKEYLDWLEANIEKEEIVQNATLAFLANMSLLDMNGKALSEFI